MRELAFILIRLRAVLVQRWVASSGVVSAMCLLTVGQKSSARFAYSGCVYTRNSSRTKILCKIVNIVHQKHHKTTYSNIYCFFNVRDWKLIKEIILYYNTNWRFDVQAYHVHVVFEIINNTINIFLMVLHRDLKMENILLDKTKEIVKLAG